MDINNPHWIIPTLVGAIIGFFLPPILNILKFLWGLKKPHRLEGRWYHYFFQYQNESVKLKSEIWDIKRNIFNSLVVEVQPQQMGETTYKGVVYFEKNFFLTKMNSTIKGHEEEVTHRFKLPSNGIEKKSVGVSTAQDYEGNAAAGGNVLSSNPLKDEEVKLLLTKNIKIYEQERIMHVVESGL